ncbi:MAG: T9SS type A sorting domain-containing protein [Bacteroidota bacterium]
MLKKMQQSVIRVISLVGLITLSSLSVKAQTYLPFNYYTFDGVTALDDNMLHNALNFNFFQSPYTISTANASGNAVGKCLVLGSTTRQIVASQPLALDSGVTIEFLWKPSADINETVQLFGRRDGALQIRFTYPNLRFLTKVTPVGSSTAVSDIMNIELSGVGRMSYGYYVDGNWHHFVFKYNAKTGEKQVWVDGQSPSEFQSVVGTGKFASNSTNATNNILDINTNTDYYKYVGSLDEIAIYPYSLHPNMIYKHYNEFKTGNHYTFNFSTTVPPVAANVVGSVDMLEFAPGHPTPTVDAVTQLKSFPTPRFKPGNTLFPNIPVLNPGHIGGYGQPNVPYSTAVTNSKEVQRQMVTAFNYTLMVASTTHEMGQFGDTTKFSGAWVKMANQNPTWKTSANSYWAQLSPAIVGYNSVNPYIECSCLSNSSYLHNSAGQLIDRNGNVVTWKTESPIMSVDSLKQDGLTQKAYVTELTNKLTRPLDVLFENGEVVTHWTENGLSVDPNVLAAKNASGLAWDKFIGRNMKRFTAGYMDQYRSLPKLSGTWVEHYQLTAHPSNWDWSETRSLNTFRNNQYYSNGDLYLQYPKAWKLGLGMAKGWQDLVEQRYVEIAMGDKLFSPVVSAGWSATEENIVRPAQYLGFLKAVALTGAENFHAGYFVTAQPYQLPENYVWQIAMPAYAQGLTSRFEDILRNGYVMEGNVPANFADPSGTPGYQFAAGDIRKLVVVRKHNTLAKYVITGTIQNYSNMQGNVEPEGNASISLDGQTVKFKIRKQGSTYIYDKTNAASPVFYQLDAWHEATHPYYWSKTFDLEAELFDNTPSGVTIKTVVPAGTAAGDFTNYTSFVTFASTGSVEYNFTPRGTTPTTHYLWVLARSVDGTSTGFSASLDGGAAKTINCVADNNWKWYRFEASTGAAITYSNLSLANHKLTLTSINSKLQIDRITLTPVSGAYYANGAAPCSGTGAFANITASGSTSFCQGGSVTLTANSGTSYQWSTGATSQAINVTTAGTFTVTVTGANGTAVSAPVAVTVNTANSASISASGPLTFCTGGSVTLSAAGATGSYLWSPGGATTQSITVTSSGTYNVKITSTGGCSSTSPNSVVTASSSNPIPSVATAAGATTFCDGGTVTLTANTGTSYLWSNGATTKSIDAAVAGNYVVTVSNGGCASLPSVAIPVIVNARPAFTVTPSGNLSFCQGGNVNLNIVNSNASAYIWYKNNTVIATAGISTTSYKATSAGKYKVRAQLGGCGKFSNEFIVTTPCREGELLGMSDFDATVYPNPFENRTTIAVHVEKEEKISIRIYDMEGRLVETIKEDFTASPGTNEFEFDAAGLGKGVYFAVVNTAFDSKRIKIASLK